jgi:NADH:ubiquinone oxidoreductase subunit 6 (subunit J)
MKWNPFLSAVGAVIYIWGITLLFHFLQAVRGDTPDSFIDPIGALSLLVFSVALMAFLFFYQPVMLLIDNKKKEAVTYFLKTLAAFGVITLFVFAAIFLWR